MPKLAKRALIALAIATALPAAACAERTDWSAAPAGKPGLVRLRIERNAPGSSNSNEDDVAAASLAGLDLNRDGDQHFALRREAGSLDCTGVVRSRHGVGECQFTPDRAFAAALARFGMAAPNDHDAFTLALVDAHLATAQALSHFGTHPSLGDYIALSLHGANPEWIEALSRAGQRNIKPGDLIAYRIHGVTGAWLHGLVAADPALARAGSGTVIGMRIQGVQPDWVQGLADAGYPNLAANDLIAMRIHGVTPDFARAAMAMGGRPSAQDLISQRITGRR